MIDKTNIIEAVLKRLERLPAGHYLDLRTYKRNRSVLIIKENVEDFLIIEDGYRKKKFYLKADKIRKTLTNLFKREFPRSHKIRLYVMGKFTDSDHRDIKRKVL
jgi:hypothetical protein